MVRSVLAMVAAVAGMAAVAAGGYDYNDKANGAWTSASSWDCVPPGGAFPQNAGDTATIDYYTITLGQQYPDVTASVTSAGRLTLTANGGVGILNLTGTSLRLDGYRYALDGQQPVINLNGNGGRWIYHGDVGTSLNPAILQGSSLLHIDLKSSESRSFFVDPASTWSGGLELWYGHLTVNTPWFLQERNLKLQDASVTVGGGDVLFSRGMDMWGDISISTVPGSGRGITFASALNGWYQTVSLASDHVVFADGSSAYLQLEPGKTPMTITGQLDVQTDLSLAIRLPMLLQDTAYSADVITSSSMAGAERITATFPYHHPWDHWSDLKLNYDTSGPTARVYVTGFCHVTPLIGDADRNGDVEFTDYAILESNFGVTPGATWEMADFNGDGAVDFTDYQMLEANYGAGVPEPATLVLLALGGLALVRRRQ